MYLSSSAVLQNLTNHSFKEIDRTLKGVTKNVLEIVKSDAKSDTEMKIKLAKLRKERLGVLALVARSQAVLAEMEVLIAENELNQELLDLKRKESSADGRKVMSLKRIKFSSVEDEGVTGEPHNGKTTNQHEKIANKPSSKSNNKKRNINSIPANCSGRNTELITAYNNDNLTNTNSSDKENYYKPVLSGKQVNLSNPPFRLSDNMKHKITGYVPVTADYPMKTTRQSHAVISNSIYEQAENTDYLLSGKPYKITSNLTIGANHLNYKDPRLYNNKFDNNCNKKGIQNLTHRGRSGKSMFVSKEIIQDNQCACNVVPKNCTNKQMKHTVISKSSSEIEASEENIKTTNDVFKDILSNKLAIKQENDDILSFSSLNTVYIGLPKSIE